MDKNNKQQELKTWEYILALRNEIATLEAEIIAGRIAKVKLEAVKDELED